MDPKVKGRRRSSQSRSVTLKTIEKSKKKEKRELERQQCEREIKEREEAIHKMQYVIDQENKTIKKGRSGTCR